MNEDAKLFAWQNSTRVTGQSLIKDLRVAAYTVPIDRRAKDNRIGFRDCLEHLIKLIIWKPLRELINLEFAEINFLFSKSLPIRAVVPLACSLALTKTILPSRSVKLLLFLNILILFLLCLNSMH